MTEDDGDVRLHQASQASSRLLLGGPTQSALVNRCKRVCVCDLVRKCMETKRERGAELHGSHYVLVCAPGFQPLSGSAGLPGTSAARGRRCKLREVLSRMSNNEAASSPKVPFQETREMMETLAARLQAATVRGMHREPW